MAVEDHAAWNVGRYTVHGELASGGMATVHIGRMGAAGGFAKLVAIKRMHPQFAKDPDFLAMFLDEARLVTRIRHPNVVQPLDVIVEGSEVLLVMEYIHGEALSRITRSLRSKNEQIPLRIAVAIMSGVLHGLHAAHEAKSEKGEPLGIVHRDVSPQNVIVGVDGVARVLDFGIAKAADQVHLTRDGELKGKLVYMAPEQLLGEAITRRADIFAAAVVLWECLTGHRLFDSDSQSALLARARMQRVEKPSAYNPEVSPQIDDIVLKGLMLQQNERWVTAREMATALEDVVAPATTAQVGAWVEKVAAKALAERQARIQEIESAGAESITSSRELVADLASDRIFTGDILSQRSASGLRALPALPGSPAARSGSQRASQPAFGRASSPPGRPSFGMGTPAPPAMQPMQQTPAPVPMQPLPPRPAFNAPSVHDPYYIPPENDAMKQSPSISLEAPALSTEFAPPARTTVVPMRPAHGGRLGLVIALLVAVLLIVVLFGAPSFVRKGIVEGFAARGIVATVDEVDLFSQVGTAHIHGLTLTSPEVPGATFHAREVLADLDGSLQATSMVARDVDVNLDVGYATLASSLSAWSKKHNVGSAFGFPASVSHARIESGHVVWNQPSGAGTRLEARSITLDMIPREGRPLGDDFSIQPTSVDVMTPLGAAGPWLLEVNRTGPAYHVHVSFNQAVQQSFGLDLLGTADGSTTTIRIVRASPMDVAAKPEEFGAVATDPVKIDSNTELTRKGAVWTGSTSLLVEAFHLPGAHPAPLSADLSFVGPAGSALDVKGGRLSFGAGDAPLTGTVSILDDAIVAKVAATVMIKCDDATVRVPLQLSLDSRNLGAASLSPLARFCAAHK